MGQVIRFSDYKTFEAGQSSNGHDSLIPIELALGIEDEKDCLSTIAKLEGCPIYPRLLSDGSGAVLFLVSVSDAIIINQLLLEQEALDDERAGICIDLIQMLENVSESLLEGAWGAIDEQQTSHSSTP